MSFPRQLLRGFPRVSPTYAVALGVIFSSAFATANPTPTPSGSGNAIFPNVARCNQIPPKIEGGNWGACDNVPGVSMNFEVMQCWAHTHFGNEIAAAEQTDGSIEVHIKCGIPSDGDTPSAIVDTYGVTAVTVDCTNVDPPMQPDVAVIAHESIQLTVNPLPCAASVKCCKGPLTSNAAQTHCAALSGAALDSDPTCNNVFAACMGATLAQADKQNFCHHRTRITQANCTRKTTCVGNDCTIVDTNCINPTPTPTPSQNPSPAPVPTPMPSPSPQPSPTPMQSPTPSPH